MRRLALLAGSGAALAIAADLPAQELPAGAADCLTAVEAALARDTPGPGTGPDAPGAAGPAVLGDLCPEFAAALAASDWGALLADGSPADVPLAGVRGFVELAERYAAERGTSGVDLAALDAIVARLRPFEPPPERSLWERAVAEVEQWLGRLAPGGRNRFVDWLRTLTLPEPWRRGLVIGVGLVLVVLVLAVIGNELRHAGALRRGRRRARRGPAAGRGGEADPAARSLEAVGAAPALRQPALLLGVVLERLGPRYPALVRPALTHRELAAEAGVLGRAPAAALGALAVSAERAAYAERAPDGAELERLYASTRSLLALAERAAEGVE